MKNQKQTEKLPSKAPNIFGIGTVLPERAALLPSVRVELLSNRQAVVEGCRGIVEYGPECIRLSADKLILRFTGSRLEIRCFTPESITVEGLIASLTYE